MTSIAKSNPFDYLKNVMVTVHYGDGDYRSVRKRGVNTDFIPLCDVVQLIVTANDDIIDTTKRSRVNYRAAIEAFKKAGPDYKDDPHYISTKKQYDHTKGFLPFVFFSGVFSGRKDDDIKECSCYIALDVDGKDQESSIDFSDEATRTVYKGRLLEHESTAVVFDSPSGQGIKVVMRIAPPSDMSVPHLKEYYHQAYAAIENEFRDRYNLIADPSCKNIGRGHYLPHDPAPLVKETEPAPYSFRFKKTEADKAIKIVQRAEKREQSEERRKFQHQVSTDSKKLIESIYEQCIAKQTSLTQSYKDWFLMACALKREFGEEYGFDIFTRFSKMDTCYDPGTARKQWDDINTDSKQGGATLASIVWLSHQHGIDIIKELKPIDQLENWLLAHYMFRRNELDGAVYWKPMGSNDSFTRFQWDYNIATVCRSAEKHLYINISDRMLDRVVRDSGYKNSFNPVTEYITALEWDGTDRLPDILKSIKTDNDDLFKEYFTKWYVNLIATSLGHDINDKVLVLQADQGSGKTFFFEKLLPDCEDWKMTEVTVKFNPEDKDDLYKAIVRPLVVFDEMSTYAKGDLQALKAFISLREFTMRVPYGKDYNNLKKICSCSGCVNDEEFLRDSTGDRRYLVFKTIDRDLELYDSIDKKQLLAQAYHMYQEGFEYRFNREDYKNVMERNAKHFTARTTDEEILRQFIYRSKGGPDDFMTITDIILLLKERHNLHLASSPKQLGIYLRNMGIKKTDQKKVNGRNLTVYYCTMDAPTDRDFGRALF